MNKFFHSIKFNIKIFLNMLKSPWVWTIFIIILLFVTSTISITHCTIKTTTYIEKHGVKSVVEKIWHETEKDK